MAGAGSGKRSRGAGSGGRSVRPRHEAQEQPDATSHSESKEATSHSESTEATSHSESGSAGKQKQQPAEEASSTSSLGLPSGGDDGGPARRTRNKTRAEKRAAADAAKELQKAEENKKKELDAAVAALREKDAEVQKHLDALQKKKEEVERLNKRHEVELESLWKAQEKESGAMKLRQEKESGALKLRHKQQIQAKTKSRQVALDAMEKQLQLDIRNKKLELEAHTPSPTAMSPNTSPQYSHPKPKYSKHYLPEYDLSSSKSKPGSSKQKDKKLNQQLEEQQRRNKLEEEKEQQQQQQQLEEEQRRAKLETKEDRRKSLDQSLKKDGTSYAALARQGELERQKSEKQRTAKAKAQQALEQQMKESEAQLEQERKLKAKEDLEAEFLGFLKSFQRKDIDGAYYKRKAQFMKICNNFDLRIRFEDVMKHSVIKENSLRMAIDFLACDTNDLLPSARNFLAEVAFDNKDEFEAVKWNVTLSFIDKPPSITPVGLLLGRPNNAVESFRNMFGQEDYFGYTLTQLGCGVFGGCLSYIFHVHSLGRTWQGDFTIENLYVVGNCQFGIAKVPGYLPGNASDQFLAKKKDIQQLSNIILPFLDCRKVEDRKDTPKPSDLPLFIPEMATEIEQMTAEDLSQEWYPEFLCNHPALKLPLPRHSFVCDTRLALKQCNLDTSVSNLFRDIPKLYDEDKKRISDWRDDYRQCGQCPIKLLKEIFEHKGGEVDSEKAKQARVGSDAFNEDLWGLTIYDRNIKQHVPERVASTSIAEVEVFSAKHVVKYIHVYLRKLLEDLLNDKKKNRDFHDIWASYKNSTPKTIDGSCVQPGQAAYSFWD